MLLRTRAGLALAFLRRLGLLRIAMLRVGARRVNRRMSDTPDLPVLLRVRVELLPVLDALQPIRWSATNTKANTNPPRSGASRQCTGERGGEEGGRTKKKDQLSRTLISLSLSPRRSCVRCVWKHPVPYARAASFPALGGVNGGGPRVSAGAYGSTWCTARVRTSYDKSHQDHRLLGWS